MPLVIGVTGSIATGKSYLCRRLAERHGVVHGDADTIVHRMYDPGKPAFDRIVATFGADVVGEDGQIDRRVLGGKAFGDAERMKALREAIGDIPAELFAWIAQRREQLSDDDVVVLEAVNLFEGEYMRRIDVGWLTACERETAIARVMARNGFTRADAEQRLASARTWQDRAPAADIVLHNDGTLAEFDATIDETFARLVEQHRAGRLSRSRWWDWRETQPPAKDSELPPEERSA